jgi:uncharacterized low-complexity protein
MACEDADTLAAAIVTAAAGPKRVQTDTTSVEAHSLPDLIAAEKHAAGKCGLANPRRGMRISKLIPEGTV